MSHEREELLQSLIEELRRVSRRIHPGRGFRFGEFALGLPQARILFIISRKNGAISVKELAGMLGVTPGAITQFVDGLAEKGLVRRSEDPNDRRVLRLKLTEVAESKFKQFWKNYFKAMSQIFSTLSDEEIEQLIRLLSKADIDSDANE
jgi:DNA-binding MarR family transcriptional regulator